MQRRSLTATSSADAMAAFVASDHVVAPFEFRSLTVDDVDEADASVVLQDAGQSNQAGEIPRSQATGAWDEIERRARPRQDRAGRDEALRNAVEAARQDGLYEGEREGRRAARMEVEAEKLALVAREREQVAAALAQFRGLRERYFAEVEQEVVKLALAIAARVLHREAQIDPLLLAGVVRVALEKMGDRSGVVLRVAAGDGDIWERVFHATDAADRPKVTEDLHLERGACVLETKMGTVELGVSVQLEEIEKGFFDLLNHRPVE
jgi:flagellar assembly protein FliH